MRRGRERLDRDERDAERLEVFAFRVEEECRFVAALRFFVGATRLGADELFFDVKRNGLLRVIGSGIAAETVRDSPDQNSTSRFLCSSPK